MMNPVWYIIILLNANEILIYRIEKFHYESQLATCAYIPDSYTTYFRGKKNENTVNY